MSIKLVRLDFRLIHGQVITKWIRSIKSNTILVVNDELANDKFMFDIYSMSAPPGINVKVMKKDDFVSECLSTNFSKEDVMVLFKSVKDIYYCYKNGAKFEAIQIGGLGAGPGRKVVFGPITLDKNDADQLTEINDSGVRVYFHQVPEDASAEFSKVISKVKF